jgi:predicted transcriptional regulator
MVIRTLNFRQIGPVSIKKLAGSLKRDYKNVHGDVQLFIKLDLIKTNKEKLVFVPWDSISIDLSLAA